MRNPDHHRLPLFLALSLAASTTLASDHVVFVSDGSFEPKDLTIAPGDTVTFKSFGNAALHNVHAYDDSFRCAKGCRGDGSATGDPAKDWSDTITFNTPGAYIPYKCDPHESFGMVGSITVSNTVATAQNIVPGISGNWYNPTANQGGHGFQVEILPGNGILAIWFVFNPAGTAQNWIYSQGGYDPASNTVTVPAFLEQGGAFPPNFDSTKLSAPAWGSLQFTFTDCNNGTVAWKSNATSAAAGYGDVTFPIQRLTSIAGTSCP